MECKFVVFSKIKHHGDSDYILVPKTEVKKISNSTIFRIEVSIKEVF